MAPRYNLPMHLWGALLKSHQDTQFYVIYEASAGTAPWVWLESSKRLLDVGSIGSDPWRRELYATRTADVPPPSLRPFPFRVLKGTKLGDLVGTSGGACVVSPRLYGYLERVRECFVEHDAVIYDKLDSRVIESQYRIIRPYNGAGPLDTTKGVFLLVMGHWRQDIHLRDAYGYHFDHSTWTGRELFALGTAPHLIITQRLADAIPWNTLENVRVVRVEEYGKDLRDAEVQQLRKRFPERFDAPPEGRAGHS